MARTAASRIKITTSPMPEVTAEHLKLSRLGNYMHTYSGRKYWPLDPRPEEVRIEDIASSLSKKARYNGHTRRASNGEDVFYSVAEHSVYCAEHDVPGFNEPIHRLARLLHDGSEGFNGDLIRPLKYDEEFRAPFQKVEELNEEALATKFGLPFPFERHVKIADEAVTAAEVRQIIYRHPSEDWSEGKLHDDSVVAPIRITCLDWRDAKELFITTFKRLVLSQYTDDLTTFDSKHPPRREGPREYRPMFPYHGPAAHWS